MRVQIFLQRGHPGIDDFRKRLDKEAEWAERRIAFGVEKRAVFLAPIRTGRLKKSIITKKKQGGKGWVVKAGAYYGIYQEFGTRYHRAQPYMRPAVRSLRPWTSKQLREIIPRAAMRKV